MMAVMAQTAMVVVVTSVVVMGRMVVRVVPAILVLVVMAQTAARVVPVLFVQAARAVAPVLLL